MDILTSPWFIITVIMAFLIGNIAAFKYLTPKNIERLKPKNDQLDRLIELDKKHHQQLNPSEKQEKEKDE